MHPAPVTTAPVDLTEYCDLIKSTLTTEGIDVILDLPKFFTDRFDSLVSYFKTSDDQLKKYSDKEMNLYFKDLLKARYKLHSKVGAIEYAAVRRRKVAIMSGLGDTDVMKLAQVLAEANTLATGKVRGVLSATKSTIVKLASDTGYRLSSRPVMVDKSYKEDTDKIKQLLASVITPKSLDDLVPMGKVVPSIPHLMQAIDSVVEFSGANNLKEFDYIRSEVSAIANYASSLHEAMVEDNDSIKKTRVKELAEYLKVSGEYVSQTINVMYLTNQATIMLTNMAKVAVK